MKFFKTIYGKILCGIVAIAIGFGAGYFVMPTKTITETKTVNVEVPGPTKYVTVTDKTQAEKLGADITSLTAQIAALETAKNDLQASKLLLQKEKEDLIKANNEANLANKAFRTAKVSGWVAQIQGDVTYHQGEIVPIDADIKTKQGLIDAQQNIIDYWLRQIVISGDSLAIQTTIWNAREAIKGYNADIVALNVHKKIHTDFIDSDNACITAIGKYINDGTVFTTDVTLRLAAFGRSI